MWMNGVDSLLVCLVLCFVSYGVSQSDSLPKQLQISSRKQAAYGDIAEIACNQLKSKGSDHFDSKILKRDIFLKVVKRGKIHKHHVKNSVGENRKGSYKETPVETQNGEHTTKHKHRTKEKTRKVTHKTRSREWNNIMSLKENKKGYKSKHSNKFLSKDNLKKDKTFNDNDNDKAETTKGKARRKPAKSVKKKHHKHRKNSDKKTSKVLPEEKLVSLRDALLVHPFNTWKFKDRFKSMADIGIHESLLHEVVENKWNTRLEHKLFKVFKGENIHMAVIGGSNTAGGGIQEDEGRTDGVFFRVISDWWRKTITPITGSHLKTRQIAMGGTGSDFFSYCHR